MRGLNLTHYSYMDWGDSQSLIYKSHFTRVFQIIDKLFLFFFCRPFVSSDLRQRRLERRDNMEEKVREIKRKQKEIEEQAITTKKRRSILLSLAAGVTIAAVCVYFYSRF